MAQGQKDRDRLRRGGFSETEVSQWEQETRGKLFDAGFSTKEIDDHFGVVQFDAEPVKAWFKGNLERLDAAGGSKPVSEVQKPELPEPPSTMAPNGTPKPARSFLENLEAGYQLSVTGLLARGKGPSVVTPEDASSFARIASMTGTTVGDIPAMIGGAFAGGMTGVPLAPVTGGASVPVMAAGGAFALPSYLRESLMQGYDKGSITSFRDWWERTSAAFIAGTKGMATGVTAAATGGTVNVAMAAATPLVRTTATVGAEIATMVTVGKALEGEVPEPRDFYEAAILWAGAKGATTVAAKARNVFAKTGVKPSEMHADMQADPTILQDILSKDVGIPRKYEAMVEKAADAPEAVTVKAPKGAVEQNPLAADGLKSEVRVEKMGAPKGEEVEPVARGDAEKAVLARIGSQEKKKSGLSWDQFYTNAVDDLHPIKQFRDLLSGKEPVAVKDDPYIAARLTRGAAGKADQFIEHATFDFNTLQNNGKSLKQVLEPFKDDRDGFRAYAVAARAAELNKRGIESGVPIEDAKAVVAGGAKYKKAFGELQEYQNKVLGYLRDSGVLDKAAFEQMLEANKSYVPFYRLLEEDVGRGTGSGLRVRNPVKAIKGSERQIVDPIESIVRNTFLYVELAERNRALGLMRDLAAKSPDGAQLMEKVPTPTKPINITEPEVAKFLADHGIESPGEGFTIFRPNRGNLAKDEIAVFTDGKREVYRVAPEVAEAVNNLDRGSVNLLVKILSQPARALRAGATLSPDFIVRNPIRDQLTAAILPTHKTIPVVDLLIGMKDLFGKNSEVYQNWLKSGGANAELVAFDRNIVEGKLFELNRQAGGFIGAVHNVVRSPLEGLRMLSTFFENASRLGVYKRYSKGSEGYGDMARAGLASREATLDFQRVGAKMHSASSMIPFMNANIQGLDAVRRAFAERPFATLTRSAALITLPSILLWAAQYDDPTYKEIPRWQKDAFWIIVTGGPTDPVFRIPKPQVIGQLFGSVIERTLDTFVGENPKAFGELQETILQSVTPPFVPTAALPFIEHWANKSSFTGNPIIPRDAEDLLPEYRYAPYTTEAAKMLAQFVGKLPAVGDSSFASPAVLENYVRAWTGGLGAYALQVADVALTESGAVPDPVKPAKTLADIPFIKAFMVRHPSAQAQSIQDFYDNFEQTKMLLATIKHQAQTGNYDDALRLARAEENQVNLMNLEGMKESLTNQHQFIRLINGNKDITPVEKRQLIDAMYLRMIEIAKTSNDLLETYRQSLKAE